MIYHLAYLFYSYRFLKIYSYCVTYNEFEIGAPEKTITKNRHDLARGSI